MQKSKQRPCSNSFSCRPPAWPLKARSLVDAQLGGDASTFLTLWLAQRLSPSQSNDERRWDAVDDVFGGASSAARSSAKPTLLGLPLTDVIQPLAERICPEARIWLIQRLEQPGKTGVWPIANSFGHRLDSLLNEIQNYRRPLAAKLNVLRQPTPQNGGDTANAAPTTQANADRLANYFDLRLDDLALRAAEHVVRRLLAELKSICDGLTAFGRELNQFATATPSPNRNPIGRASTGVDSSPPGQQTPIESIRSHLSALTANVEARLQRDFLNAQGGLFNVILLGGRSRAQLAVKIQEFVRVSPRIP